MNNILPFLPLAEIYNNIVHDELSGEIIGDCKVCNQQKVPVLRHECYSKVYKKFKDDFRARQEADNSTPSGNT
jgi:hypothetical protein